MEIEQRKLHVLLNEAGWGKMLSKGPSVMTFQDYETKSSLQTFSRNHMWVIGKFGVREFDLFQNQLTDPSRERNALGYESPDGSGGSQ